jgi:hypothetical protein
LPKPGLFQGEAAARTSAPLAALDQICLSPRPIVEGVPERHEPRIGKGGIRSKRFDNDLKLGRDCISMRLLARHAFRNLGRGVF